MKRNKAVAEQVAQLVTAGNDSHIAARSLGMSDADLDDWLENWPWFKAEMDRAYARAEVKLVEKMYAGEILRMRKSRARSAHFERLRALST